MSSRKQMTQLVASTLLGMATVWLAGCEQEKTPVVPPAEELETPEAAPIPEPADPVDEPEPLPSSEPQFPPDFPEAGSTINRGGADVPDFE